MKTCEFKTYVCVSACSIMSNSLWSHVLQPFKLLSPWNFPGNSTIGDCHCSLQGILPTQASKLHLLHFLNWQADSLPLCHPKPLGCSKSIAKREVYSKTRETSHKQHNLTPKATRKRIKNFKLGRRKEIIKNRAEIN